MDFLLRKLLRTWQLPDFFFFSTSNSRRKRLPRWWTWMWWDDKSNLLYEGTRVEGFIVSGSIAMPISLKLTSTSLKIHKVGENRTQDNDFVLRMSGGCQPLMLSTFKSHDHHLWWNQRWEMDFLLLKLPLVPRFLTFSSPIQSKFRAKKAPKVWNLDMIGWKNSIQFVKVSRQMAWRALVVGCRADGPCAVHAKAEKESEQCFWAAELLSCSALASFTAEWSKC